MKKEYRQKVDLTEGSVIKGLLIVAIPILLTSLFELAYNLTDLFWLGRVDSIGIDSSSALAGSGIAGYIMWFGAGLFLLAKTGVGIKVARYVGAKREDKVDSYVSSGLFIALIIGVIFAILAVVLVKPYMSLFGVTGQAAEYCRSYILWISIGIPFFFVNPVFSSIYNSLGKSYKSLIIGGTGLALNMIFDPLFIFVFKLGVAGAAIASSLSLIMETSIYVITFLNKNNNVKIRIRNIEKHSLSEILKTSFPSSISTLIFCTISMIVATQVSSFGDSAIAGQKVGNQIESLVWLVSGGLQVATVSFVGQNYGAQNFIRIKKGCYCSIGICLVYGVIVSLILGFGSEFLIALFAPNDPESIRIGSIYLKFLACAEMINILESASTGIFNGLDHTKLPSSISMVGNLIRIPLVFILVPRLGLNGVWWTIVISMITKGITCFIALVIFIKKKGLFKKQVSMI